MYPPPPRQPCVHCEQHAIIVPPNNSEGGQSTRTRPGTALDLEPAPTLCHGCGRRLRSTTRWCAAVTDPSLVERTSPCPPAAVEVTNKNKEHLKSFQWSLQRVRPHAHTATEVSAQTCAFSFARYVFSGFASKGAEEPAVWRRATSTSRVQNSWLTAMTVWLGQEWIQSTRLLLLCTMLSEHRWNWSCIVARMPCSNCVNNMARHTLGVQNSASWQPRPHHPDHPQQPTPTLTCSNQISTRPPDDFVGTGV